jgi:hypothetical protein
VKPFQTDKSAAAEASHIFRDSRLKDVQQVLVENSSGEDAYLLLFDKATAVQADDPAEFPSQLIPAGTTAGLANCGVFVNGCQAALSTTPEKFTSAGAVGVFYARYET